ncbi:hypothetical protein PP707_01405 [Acetobacter pasteurianus]|nr:hypothetical protein [Acetobacter pasteurianus]
MLSPSSSPSSSSSSSLLLKATCLYNVFVNYFYCFINIVKEHYIYISRQSDGNF